MLIRLFGPEAPGLVSGTGPARRAPTGSLSPEPGLTATLSSLARLDAARATSPVPPGLAVVGGRGRRTRRTRRPARAGPRRGPASGEPSCSGSWTASKTLPAEAVRTAVAAARIHAVTDPQAAARLRGSPEEADRAHPGQPAAGRRVRRGGRGREARKGPGAPGWPALDARPRPRARRALPARVVALLGPLGAA